MSLVRHLRAAILAWREENRRLREERRNWVDTEFLAAALEIAETPPPPAARAILWLIVAAAVVAIAWAFIGRVDTVAVAEGRFASTGRLRTIEPADPGIVRSIAVREGDRVKAGQILVSFDATMADADAAAAQTELATAALVRARADALLASTGGVPATLAAPAGAPPAALRAEQQAVNARVREFAQRRAALEERRSAAAATVRVSQANVDKLLQAIPFAAQQVAAYETLAVQGYGSRMRLAQERERHTGLTHDLTAERARRDEARAQYAALSRELSQILEEFRAQAARERAEAEGVVATRTEDVRKADRRQSFQTLRAPVDGTVQQVSVATIGEIAEAGKPVVTIVAKGEELVVEALILNRDIGSIQKGDRVVVKVEAYPFTRYGSLVGHVTRVSPDAIADEQRGLVFPITIRLDKVQTGRAATRTLSPGMSVVAEVMTGRRRIIDFLLSPIAKATSEAGRER